MPGCLFAHERVRPPVPPLPSARTLRQGRPRAGRAGIKHHPQCSSSGPQGGLNHPPRGNRKANGTLPCPIHKLLLPSRAGQGLRFARQGFSNTSGVPGSARDPPSHSILTTGLKSSTVIPVSETREPRLREAKQLSRGSGARGRELGFDPRTWNAQSRPFQESCFYGKPDILPCMSCPCLTLNPC